MSIWGKIWDIGTDIAHGLTGTPTAAQKRDTMSAANNQIDMYKKQTEIASSALASAKNEQDAQKRRIEEKQIRGLRRNFQSSSLLDNSDSGMSDKLGG